MIWRKENILFEECPIPLAFTTYMYFTIPYNTIKLFHVHQTKLVHNWQQQDTFHTYKKDDRLLELHSARLKLHVHETKLAHLLQKHKIHFHLLELHST